MTQIPRTFWMVYGAGQNAPAVRHKTFDSALSEARRLARLVPDVEVTPMDAATGFDDDGIPF